MKKKSIHLNPNLKKILINNSETIKHRVIIHGKNFNKNNSKITGVHFTRKNYFSISKLFLCNCIKY